MSRIIADLDPKIQERARLMIGKLEESGMRYSILETRRSGPRHASLYAQGREPLERINALRSLSGYDPIQDDEARRIVTWTRHSLHQDGLALDVAIVMANGQIPWNVRDATIAALWMKLGEIGESCGLVWGGRWPPFDRWGFGKDMPHFQAEA